MQFLDKQSSDLRSNYAKHLALMGSLSNLFSESLSPYIDSRISENLFCRVFNALNLGRNDTSADAAVGHLGFGIKTFLENNGRSNQKVAEFNRDRKNFEGLPANDLIHEVSRLRNKRIEATKSISNLDSVIYHCVTRTKAKIKVFEEPMHSVDLDSIRNIEQRDNVISFTDGLEEYRFNLAKSVLLKRFTTPQSVFEVPVEILDDPFDLLEKYLGDTGEHTLEKTAMRQESIILPLYSARSGKVEAKSGLNQWNAGGRKRQSDEVYIPIPTSIYKYFPDFFPERDESFDLNLPTGETISAKVCQENSKALMSNPNVKLGKWLLRDVLKLGKNELVTLEKLEEIGLDSVEILKIRTNQYSINFKKTGSFEDFKHESLEN